VLACAASTALPNFAGAKASPKAVSITQSFNTTSSMGRLTLNVLLSFAQFEREMIGERVRDKIAASKRKGLWVGGPVPLGYRRIDKKLEIVPEEAETVRTIFTLYLELGSMGALLAELDRRAIRTKINSRRDGQKSGGIRFGVGSLAHLLKNRFYIGEVAYRGEVHRGEHESILSHELFAGGVGGNFGLHGHTGTMSRMRFCKIAKPKRAALPACRLPTLRTSCVTACAGIGPKSARDIV
jgi:Recombinase/Resolvase, N terminal domain